MNISAKRKLVVVQLTGGNDYLNCVVPYNDPIYFDSRKNVGIAEDKVLPIDNGLGLNPGMGPIKDLYDQGKGKEALFYLKDRGLSVETLKEFGVGFALPSWDGLTHYLLKNGAKPFDLVQSGLVVAKDSSDQGTLHASDYYDRFRGRVMVPIFDHSNEKYH